MLVHQRVNHPAIYWGTPISGNPHLPMVDENQKQFVDDVPNKTHWFPMGEIPHLSRHCEGQVDLGPGFPKGLVPHREGRRQRHVACLTVNFCLGKCENHGTIVATDSG